MRILIIKLSSLGDVIHSLPSLEALKKGLPGARIDWVVEKQNAQILEAHPYIERLIVLHRKTWMKRPWGMGTIWAGLREFINELKSEEYDLVIDFQGLFRSGILVGLSRGRRKIGFDRVREAAHLFYTERVPYVSLDQHAVTRYLQIPKYLGIRSETPRFFLPITQRAHEEANNLFKETGLNRVKDHRIVFVNPNARWHSKQWPWEYFRQLIKALSVEGKEVVLIGGLDERAKMESAFLGSGDHIHNLAGRTTLMGLAAMFKKGGCLVTNDSGPMHLAVAVGLPVVAIFGPTNPIRTGPFGWQNKATHNRVLFTQESCAPCYKKHCNNKSCLSAISADRVLKAVEEVVDAPCSQIKIKHP